MASNEYDQEKGARQPKESDPLIVSHRGKGSPAPVKRKCLCSSQGCFVTRLWSIFTIFFILLLVSVAVFITYYLTRRHYIDTYGLPPEPQAQPSPAFHGRLSEDLKPINYNVRVTPYLDEEDGDKRFTFDGEVAIQIECFQRTNVIVLHTLKLEVNTSSIAVENLNTSENVIIRRTDGDQEYDFFRIHLGRSLSTGNRYLVSMRYTGTLNSTDANGRLVGFYQSSYESDGDTRYLASTQLETTYARRVFPSFDEPSFKATFGITVVHRNSRSAISNMPIVRNEIDGEWNTTMFDTTVVMSTYLVAIVVSDFEYKETVTDHGIQFRVWSTADNLIATEYALEFGSECLTYFEDLWGIPYPLPKMDMIALPMFSSGAMENWGLITYRDYRMLVFEDDPPSQRQAAALVITHELIHMWFGNLVTLAWWDDTWLNEGFATFYEKAGVERLNPDWQIYEQFYQDMVTFDSLRDDGHFGSHPTVMPVGWYHELRGQFGSQSYERGSAMLMMIISFLGEDVFFEGVNNYLRDKAYGNAARADLWNHLTQADVGRGNHSVEEIMDPWLLQLGYPVVTVTRTANQVTATQERFLLDPNDEPLIPGEYPELGPWSIPLTYIHRDGFSLQQQWLTSESVTFNLSGAGAGDWLLVNINQTGYYRVNYDDDNWMKLIDQLKQGHQALTNQNRAALVDDAFNLGQAQRVNFTIPLELMGYMTNEMDYGPWKAAENGVKYIDRMLKRSALYGDLRRFVNTQISPLYSQFGWHLTALDHVDYHSAVVGIRMACNYGNRNCTNKAGEVFDEWLEDPVSYSLSIDIRATVVCIGLMNGDEVEWDAVHAVLETTRGSPDTRLADDLKQALACSAKPWILQTYMDKYLHTGEATQIISYVANTTTVGFLLAWDYALEHFETLLQIDETAAYDLMWQFSNTMNTPADKDKLDDFGSKYNKMPADSALGFYKARRKVHTNIQWMEKNYQEIEAFLKT
ncbi:aminopeptidase N-like [Ptychodera flava]|uniref:aminopeptidase N-like n=1 Tax=Ptychodera flava TaxID=63121 RepID=UPI003969CBA5